MSKLIEEKIRTTVAQEISVKQLATAHGKNIVINCPVMINGNDAIERACAEDGNVIAALKHIISILPEPKEVWLISLAMVAAIEMAGNKTEAAKLMGWGRTRFSCVEHGYAEKVKAIQDGKITLRE